MTGKGGNAMSKHMNSFSSEATPRSKKSFFSRKKNRMREGKGWVFHRHEEDGEKVVLLCSRGAQGKGEGGMMLSQATLVCWN
ncbi:hypothetical protein Naga_101902g1 [Nannochloropsis gaditana]|uniref:Uncharacterized protein n=1 Tax=Nannochloropsis gaditana TaxID=72520 RepID=W7TGL6_9STRA|nr:hypothetical protein Naga_101902g1 [Nannochloropsis gaditana]